jgi:lysophospholipase L1-like esterase
MAVEQTVGMMARGGTLGSVPGRGGMFSLGNGRERRFLIRAAALEPRRPAVPDGGRRYAMGRNGRLILLCAAALLSTTPACADGGQKPYQSAPERRTAGPERDWGEWLGPFRQRLAPVLMQDFGERYLYQPANAALPPPRADETRVVFLGDSITDGWNLAAAFPGRPYVNRGVGAQVTAQMLLRFHQDVIALKPRAVVILAGTNDLHGFMQQETDAQIETNLEAMADLADRHNIAVVFASILPLHNYTKAAENTLKDRDPTRIAAINAWLRRFCAERGYVYADYSTALVDAKGMMTKDYSADGLHPIAAGYARMAPVAAAAIDQALAKAAPASR